MAHPGDLESTNTSIDAPNFYETRFGATQQWKRTDLVLPALNRKVHPLFDEKLFTNLPKGGYSVISQSLRLASHILESKVLLTFFHTLLKQKEHYWELHTDPHNCGLEYDIEQIEADRVLSSEEIFTVTSELRKLPQYVRYNFKDGIDYPHTEQQGEEHIEVPGIATGYRSEVYIPREKFDTLRKATKNSADVLHLLYLRWELAVALVHEIAHCVRNAVNGKVDAEPYFGREIVSELGFELERRLFDGHLTTLYETEHFNTYDDGIDSAFGGLLVLWEYPYQGLVQTYLDGGMGIRGHPTDSRTCDLAWRVNIDFLFRFFSEDWWAKDADVRTNWHPKRALGYTFRLDGDDKIAVTKAADEEKYFPVKPKYRRLRSGDITLWKPKGSGLQEVTKTQLELWRGEPTTQLPWHRPDQSMNVYEGRTMKEIARLKRRPPWTD